jgi:DNA repair exonuclease SbcCD ATPase subunit
MTAIAKIEIHNFMIFAGTQILDLPMGSIAIVARYVENDRRSNWAGKTAFLEAIEWALSGNHRKRLDEDVITWGAPDVYVSITLTTGMKIRRSLARGKTTKLVVNQPNGETLTQKAGEDAIRAAIGLDFDDLRATTFIAQADVEAIVGKLSSKRREVIEGWLDLQVWGRVAARIRGRLKTEIDTLRALEARAKVLEESVESKPDHESIQRLETEIETPDPEVVAANQVIQAHGASAMVRQWEHELESLKVEAGILKQRLQGAFVSPTSIAEVQEVFGEASGEFTAAEKGFVSAKALVGGQFDGRCPITCSDCPVADTVREDQVSAKARLVTESKRLESTRAALTKASQDLAEINNRDRKFRSDRDRMNAIVERSKLLKSKIEAAPVPPTLEEVERARSVYEKARIESVEKIAKLSTMREVLRRYTAAIDELDTTTAKIFGQRQIVEDLNLANQATRSAGIPSLIAERSLQVLERRANLILGSSGLSIKFAWERETTQVTPVCLNCGYLFKGTRDKACPACSEARGMKRSDDLEILTDDGTRVFEDARHKSGGAKTLIGVAIRLSAGSMLRDRRSSTWGVALVDEPFGFLDAENRDAMAQKFNGLLSSVGLVQAFVVSHDAELLESMASKIEIVRDREGSTIKLV